MEFRQVISQRETVRSFDGRKPTEEQLQQILEAGRLTPTAYNRQPQRVYVLESEEALRSMDSVHPCRYNAPVVLMVCADKNLTGNDQRWESTHQVDASIAATHMLLAACDAGVDSAWVGVFDPAATQKAFALAENIVPICFLDLGFRTQGYKTSPSHTKRNPLSAMVTWL